MKKILFFLLFSFILHINLNAQCNPDRHNTTWYDGWISCEVAPNPNPEHDVGHWLLYDFGHSYALGQMYYWNTNAIDYLESGVNEVRIEYSYDGVFWNELGNYFFEKGTGSAFYNGEAGPDFEGVNARFVLITALSNHGGECYGLSEVKIETTGVVTSTDDLLEESSCLQVRIYPNPYVVSANVELKSECNIPVQYTVQDAYGKTVVNEQNLDIFRKTQFSLEDNDLSAGVYFLNIKQGDWQGKYKVIKLSK